MARCGIGAAIAGVVALAIGCGGGGSSAGRPGGGVPPERQATAHPTFDDGNDEPDDIEVEGTKGSFQPGQIEQALDPHLQALSACYQELSRKTKYIGGKLELRYVVARDGALRKVQVATSDVGSWTVERCILGVAREVEFPTPRGGDAEFSVPLDFSSPRSPDWWDESRAETEVGDVKSQLTECGAANDVVVTLYVGPHGKVTSVGFASASAAAPLADEWATCAETKIKAWVMTDPRGKIAKMSFRYGS